MGTRAGGYVGKGIVVALFLASALAAMSAATSKVLHFQLRPDPLAK
jgi:hypothetical protein